MGERASRVFGLYHEEESEDIRDAATGLVPAHINPFSTPAMWIYAVLARGGYIMAVSAGNAINETYRFFIKRYNRHLSLPLFSSPRRFSLRLPGNPCVRWKGDHMSTIVDKSHEVLPHCSGISIPKRLYYSID